MNMNFKEPLKEGVIYDGIIKKYIIKENKFLTFVELDEEPDMYYLNSQKMVKRTDSLFYKFCISMDLFDENGMLGFDRLIDVPVVVAFKSGKSGTMFICMMDKAEKYYEYEEEEDEDCE